MVCFFCSAVAKVQSEVPFSYNTYFEYLPPPNQDLYKRRKTFCLNNRHYFLTLLILKHLSIIFNIPFATRIIPEKVVNVIPIHNKDPKLECSNYRSISILSNIDKILDRLMNFLTEQEIFYLQQFGFRKNFSTAHAIKNLIDVSKMHLTNTNLCAGFLLTSRNHLTQLIKRPC